MNLNTSFGKGLLRRMNIFFVLFLSIVFFSPVAFASFSDVYEGEKAIQYLEKQGIVNGYPDGTFRPEQEISRVEFVKIVLEAKWKTQSAINNEAKEKCKNKFRDVREEDWFFGYVCNAWQNNILSGYEDGIFRPNQNISLVEATKIIVIAFGIDYQENKNIWYEPFLNILSQRKAIPPSVIDIDKKITRYDMAEIIWRTKENITDQEYVSFEGGSCFCIPSGRGFGQYGNDMKCSVQCCSGSVDLPVFHIFPKESGNVYSLNTDEGNMCFPATGGGVCAPCGNGICEDSLQETDCNCPADCKGKKEGEGKELRY